MSRAFTLFVLVAWVLSFRVAQGQEELQRFLGLSGGDLFGRSFCFADTDGDSVKDLVASGRDFASIDDGYVVVISGATGAVLFTRSGDPDSRFGISLCSVGDVNLDGREDFAVGADGAGSGGAGGLGVVTLFSGTGAVLESWTGTGNDRFGAEIASGADLDGDGFFELIVGADGTGAGGPNSGTVRVYSPFSQSPIYEISGTQSTEFFGSAVSFVGDANSDGIVDFAGGGPGYDGLSGQNSGRVRIFDGATGGLLHEIFGLGAFDLFGFSIDALDVNVGRLDELLIGAPSANNGVGYARVVTPTGGVVFHNVGHPASVSFFGDAVSNAGDVNGDGILDFLVGAFNSSAHAPNGGYVTLHSGKTGKPLYEFSGGPVELFGTAVSAAGDWNGDGFGDIAFSSPLAGGPFPGSVRIHGGNDLFLDAHPKRITAGTNVTLSVGEGEPFSPVLLALVDIAGTPTFKTILVTTLDVDGRLSLTGTIPLSLAGITLGFKGLTLMSGSLAQSAIETLTIF